MGSKEPEMLLDFLFEQQSGWGRHFDMRKVKEEASLGKETKTQQLPRKKKLVPPSLSCSKLLWTFGPSMSAPMSPTLGQHVRLTPLHLSCAPLCGPVTFFSAFKYLQLFDHLTNALPPSSLNCKLSSYGSSAPTLA